MRPWARRSGRLLPLLVAATACSPLNFAGETTLARLSDEELCGRRSNLVNGGLMVQELARRGVDCAPWDEAALQRGFSLGFLTPPSLAPVSPWGGGRAYGIEQQQPQPVLPPVAGYAAPLPPMADRGGGVPAPPMPDSGAALPPVAGRAPAPYLAPPQAALLPPPRAALPAPQDLAPAAAPSMAEGPPTTPMPAEGPAALTPRAAAAAPILPPPRLPPEPQAERSGSAAAAIAPPPPPRVESTPAATAPAASAPFVTPGCAAREVRQASDGAEAAWSVVFRNTCAFPVRVLFAARPGAALATATPLLRPGETSPPATIPAGFRQPGYAVCGYQSTSESLPCRME